MKKLKYPYARPDVTSGDINAVVKVLNNQYLAQGKIVKKLQSKLQNKFEVSGLLFATLGQLLFIQFIDL